MRSLFVMDPLDRINVRGDSTYVTMRECTDRGWPAFFCTPGDLYAVDGVAFARAAPVLTTAEAPHFTTEPVEEHPLGAFDVVWMRKDPPFDMGYIFTTWLLDMAPPATLVVNDPVGLKVFNEKLWAMAFRDLHPKTLLSRDPAQVRAFVHAMGGKVVLKPWHGSGGHGVVVTEAADRNLGSLIEMLTHDGRQYAIVQQYLPGIARGDKRILLFEGEPVAAVLRVPSEADHRGNIHVGARVERCELDARDHAICAAIGPELKERGLVFVGIDVIDGWLTEINVTSPTGLQEANRLYGLKLEADLVDRVARLVRERKGEAR